MSRPATLAPRQTLTQRLALNTRLVSSLAVLRMTGDGLSRYLEEQAAQNPNLRLEPPALPTEWLPRWTTVLGDAPAALIVAAGPSLLAHVTERIDLVLRDKAERRLAYFLADALEPSGWLGRPLAEIAQEAGCTPMALEALLEKLQHIEPAGIFARNLTECLALQLREDGLLDAAYVAILSRLDLLASGDFVRLARVTGLDEDALRARFAVIRGLDPKPGARFGAAAAAPIREPDLLVRSTETGWDVSLNRSSLPTLTVQKSDQGTPESLAAARALGRIVEARNSTLLRVAREMMQRQEGALVGGLALLRPMTMGEVAGSLSLAESTISRVVAGAAVDTPHGTWWLRKLFSGRVSTANPELSAEGVRSLLAGLIAAEDRSRPLSDAALQQALHLRGALVARRTVAKYREMMGIAPAHRRRG